MAVERILDYQFKNKRLFKEALTHSSYTDSSSYQRLEFIGDATLGCAFSNYVFLSYPDLDPGQLSIIRAANISTEKLAHVTIRHELHRFVRHNAAALHEKVQDFVFATLDEDDAISYGGSVKAPKILADIVESVAAAVYVDCGFDLQAFWVVFRHILEPIVTIEDLYQQPQPVTMLFEVCQKKGKQVNIKYWRKGLKNIVSVFVDGKFVASSSSEQKETTKLHAAKEALRKLTQSEINNVEGTDITVGEFSGVYEIDGAKQRLHELCGKKKWPKPCYRWNQRGGRDDLLILLHDKEIHHMEKMVIAMIGEQKIWLINLCWYVKLLSSLKNVAGMMEFAPMRFFGMEKLALILRSSL